MLNNQFDYDGKKTGSSEPVFLCKKEKGLLRRYASRNDGGEGLERAYNFKRKSKRSGWII